MKDHKTMYKDYYIPQNLEYSRKGIFLAGFGSYYGTAKKTANEQQADVEWIRGVIDRK